MQVVVIIAEFKQHLKAAGYAAATIANYRKYLNQFQRFLTDTPISDLRKVTHQTTVDYQSLVAGEPVAAETKAMKIRPVKRLFEHLVTAHKLLINPCEGIVETCRKHRKIGPVLTIEEVQKLMCQPNLSIKTGIRDRAIMEVLYASAIRLNELLSLEIYHADLKDKVLYIRKGKGKKQRVVPLGKMATARLREYLEKIRPYHARKHRRQRRMFLNHSGRCMTAESVRALLRKYRRQAGITKPVSPHMFRKAIATHLMQQGADIRYIQKLLGHRSLKTTQSYTKVMPVEIKQTHNRTHPRNSL
jgi:integrase/recombinase XerD